MHTNSLLTQIVDQNVPSGNLYVSVVVAGIPFLATRWVDYITLCWASFIQFKFPVTLDELKSIMDCFRTAECCAYCFASPEEKQTVLWRCTGCDVVQFCSRECQRAHWHRQDHKRYCRILHRLNEDRLSMMVYGP